MSARLQALHLTSPLRRKGLATLRGLTILGALERINLTTRLNWAVETIAGNASSTRTGSALSLAFTPQINVPVYVSLMRIAWRVVLPQRFPLGLAMPSSLSVRAMSSVDFPASDMSKIRLTTLDESGSGSSLGLFLGPSWTITLL